jgi:beta-glucosidase
LKLSMANDMTGNTIPAACWKDGVKRIKDGEVVQIDSLIDFTKVSGTELAPDSLFTWEGILVVPEDGVYTLNLQMIGVIATLIVDGSHVSHASSMVGARHGDTVQPGQDDLLPTRDGLNSVRRYVQLNKGEHKVVIETNTDTSHLPVQLRLNWTSEQSRKEVRQGAVETAREAEVAIVFAWGRLVSDYALPDDQNSLISEIASVNSNTIVVLNSSLPTGMPWLENVRAVLEMWWTGDEGGIATANILTGSVSPAGRLPFTWAKEDKDYPASDPRFPERGQRLDGVVKYSEGLDVGYRWFDREKITPLFAFGHGLTYTSFEYSNLQVSPEDESAAVTVSFHVKNTGLVDSDEVPQVYLGAPDPVPEDGKFPVKALVGFERVNISSGKTANVVVKLSVRRFQYWSEESRSWKLAKTGRNLFVGASATDIRLQTGL